MALLKHNHQHWGIMHVEKKKEKKEKRRWGVVGVGWGEVSKVPCDIQFLLYKWQLNLLAHFLRRPACLAFSWPHGPPVALSVVMLVAWDHLCSFWHGHSHCRCLLREREKKRKRMLMKTINFNLNKSETRMTAMFWNKIQTYDRFKGTGKQRSSGKRR